MFPDLEDDDDLYMADLVHDAVTLAGKFIESWDKTLNHPENSAKKFVKRLRAVREVLSVNADLAKDLYEENQALKEEIAELKKKHGISTED